MSNEKKAGAYDHVTPQMVKQVDGVLAEAEKHTYSVSRVFAAYNAVMQKRDTPQTCSSCLRNRVRELKQWKAAYDKVTAPKAAKVVPFVPAPVGKAEYVETFIIIDGERRTVLDDNDQLATVIFTPAEEGAHFGKATDVDGKPAPAFVYEQNGKAYLVSGEEGDYTEVTGEPIAEVTEDLDTDKAEGTDKAEDTDKAEGTDKAEDTDKAEGTDKAVTPQYDDPSAPGYVDQAEGTVRYPMAEGIPFDFLPNEGTLVKGTVKRADGTTVKPGTYVTAEGLEIAVQVGGKATIKEIEDLT